MKSKEFISIDNKHRIDVEIIKGIDDDDNVAFFSIVDFEYENYKTFLLLFKDVINYFIENKVYSVKQYILKNDIENFSYSEIPNIEGLDENSVIMINTPLSKFPEEIYSSLGLKKI